MQEHGEWDHYSFLLVLVKFESTEENRVSIYIHRHIKCEEAFKSGF